MNGVVLHAHPVRGESHIQRNTTQQYTRSSQVWGTTVVDTFALCHYKDSAVQTSTTARNNLLNDYCLQPVAFETTGVYGKTTAPFLSGLT